MGDDALRSFLEFSKRGQIPQMEMTLTDYKVNVNGRDTIGCTALHWTAGAGHLEALKWLLSKGANPDIQSSNGDTPLHKAAWRGNAECCAALVAANANRNLRNRENKFAEDYAKDEKTRRGCTPIVKAKATTQTALQRALEKAGGS
eukprot:TRINITY_DN49_c0_g1_i1.p1 TRINITY_DN49_c0_g1~~TRINITY_DN49_c0_g1_i1.p1  ORF type:complete len:162 (-),score=29.21 TRINITY_DN49_c0_g1_i1:118-555(-)